MKIRQKMSQSKIGKKVTPFSDLHKARLSNAHTGKVLTESHKKKIGEAHTGEKNGFFLEKFILKKREKSCEKLPLNSGKRSGGKHE